MVDGATRAIYHLHTFPVTAKDTPSMLRSVCPSLLAALSETVGVAVGVLEFGPPSPVLLGRLSIELDALRLQFGVGLLDIVAVEEDVGEGADTILLIVGRVEHKDGVSIRRDHFDPARRVRPL